MRPPFRRPRPQGQKPSKAHPTSWDRVADWYADYLSQPGTVQADIVFPGALQLLELKPNQRLLDIACGEGAFTRLAVKNKHLQTTGVDAAPNLIEKAKRQAQRTSAYLTADATNFSHLLKGQAFDGASCILAIQNIDKPERVFEEANKLLKPGSPFVLVMNHPAFRQPRQSGWGWDEERKLQYRRVDRYLNSYEQPIIAHPGSAPQVKTFSFHRPLSFYINALNKAGFVVDQMQEWVSNKTSDSGPRAKAENIARAEIPLFLAIRARKK